VIVVLGNRPPVDANGRVASETARRVRHGVALFRRGLAPQLLVTGGLDPGNVQIEADVMARYAHELGVPSNAIVRERRSQDTVQNARYSIAALCGRRARCRPSVIVVSSPYHLRRAVRLFRCAGARVQYDASALPDAETRARFAALEYGARLLYVFDDACARANPNRR
jgi:uncharacterized SAM-binding protein YcdF (DUF218 family)